MRILTKEIEHRKFLIDNMIKYGFVKQDSSYVYQEKICDDKFLVVITYLDGIISTRVIDLELNDDFVLLDIKDNFGEYTAHVREEYDKVLSCMILSCSISSVFLSRQALMLSKYIKDTYGEDLEFLWESYPDAAIVRHADNRKWYILFMRISRKKLGFDSDEIVEIIDLKYPKHKIDDLIDYVKFFPGYHMNKSSWITIPLDDTLNDKELIEYLTISYQLQ